ncbi:MAG: hypothetical protein KAS63_04915 [Candidatus Heimdallarchaeota archaeon]|nr:hypothetical protein [Candidatus Heimdallarchaeota archaeon]MCK4954677.1 hypothetical protein [Candidatus Heimdallarchaeota archaeon]
MMSKQIYAKKMVLGGFLALIVFSSFLYLPVYADNHDDEDETDEDDDGIDDHIEDENEREVSVELSDNEAEIESSLKTDGIKNEFEVKVKTGYEGLEFELEFEKDNQTVETELEFEVKITKIVEYRDIDSDGIYNSSVDEKIQVYKLDEFNPIQYTVETISNNTVHVFSVETVDSVFSATLYVTGEFADINGVVIAPTQVKVDIGIHNFNYTELDTMLALKVKLESEFEVDYEEDEETEDELEDRAIDESEIEITLGDYSGFFSWIETAMIDGIVHDVKVTPLDMSPEENKMYLNYPRGNEIIHDPKIGVSNLLQIGLVGNNNLIFISAAALLSITGLVLIFRRKNKK